MLQLASDLRYAARVLRTNPGFAAVAVLTIALGIGANMIIFAFVDTLLVRPLDQIREPDRVVTVRGVNALGYQTSISYPDLEDLQQRNRVFDGVAAFWSQSLHTRIGEVTERVQGALASGSYFSVLGVVPAAGRMIDDDDDRERRQVVVLSAAYARARFADGEAVGRTLHVNGHPFTVVGVSPSGFRGTSLETVPDLWAPLSLYPILTPPSWKQFATLRGARWLRVLARLRDGVARHGVSGELDALAASLAVEHPRSHAGWGLRANPLVEGQLSYELRSQIRSHSVLLTLAVGLVLLIACVNVANLLLARAASRQRELAIRATLGASRRHLLRQMLAESTCLALPAGLVALLGTAWAVPLVERSLPLPVRLDVTLDSRLLAGALAVTLASLFLFGLLPALRSSRPALSPALRGVGRRDGRLRDLLVAAQFGLSLVLLVVAGLFLRSLHNLVASDLGFDPENVLVATVDPSLQGYEGEAIGRFYDELLAEIRATPGVIAASFTNTVQTSGDDLVWDVRLEGYEVEEGEEPELNLAVVGSDYVRTMGTTLLAGRDFLPGDREGTPGVTIVNRALAERFWPGEPALGKRVSVEEEGNDWLEVVGVVENGKYVALRDGALPFFLLPQAQFYEGFFEGGARYLLVRSDADPVLLAQSVRGILERLDNELPLFDVQTLSAVVRGSVALERTMTWVLGVFAAAALALAAIGLYGVLSYSVSRRTREIGIRVALGADNGAVVGRFLVEALRLAAAGAVAGTLAALLLGRLASSLLFGLESFDPVTLLAALLTLAATAIVAAVRPALRASRVDPTVALRFE